MNIGAFGENFPYTNFHDLNLDWILKIAKDFLDQYTSIQEIITNGEASLTGITEEGLQDLQNKAETLIAVLQEWYDTHSDDLEDELAEAVASFNTTASSIANTVIGTIPADYSQVARLTSEFKSDLLYLNAYNIIDDVTKTGRTHNGVTFTFNQDKCLIQGTATGLAFCNIYASTSTLPPNISAGEKVYPGLIGWNNVSFMEIYSYDDQENATLIYNSKSTYNYDYLVIPTSAVGLTIRLCVADTNVANELVYPYLSKTPPQSTLNDRTFRDWVWENAVFLKAIPTVTTPADRTYEINRLLGLYKYVYLLEGDYYVNGTINMPEGTTLIGVAGATKIISTYTDGACINLNNNCTVENILLYGGEDSTPTIGSHNALNIYQKTGPAFIKNCIIKGFNRAGISINGKGGGTTPYFISDCMIENCYFGVWINESEYIDFKAIGAKACAVGVWDNGGNNKYVQCGFDSNAIGVQMATSYSNNAHGIFSGCSMNHNSSYAIYLSDVSNGEIFTGCQIHFGTIFISGGTKGINFTGCQFGNQIVINYDTANQNYINASEFWTTPTINKTGQGVLKIHECYNIQTGDPIQ